MASASSKIVSEGRVEARPSKMNSYILKNILALNYKEERPCTMSNDSLLLMKKKKKVLQGKRIRCFFRRLTVPIWEFSSWKQLFKN